MSPASIPRTAALLAGLALASALAGAQAGEPPAPAGLAVFSRVCAACHQPGGTGTPGVAPPLAGTLAPLLGSPAGRRYIAGVLTQGLSGKLGAQGSFFAGAMPTQAALSDAELADVANYLARDLNGTAADFTGDDLAQARAARTPHKALRALREQALQ